jgi:ribosomal protein S20
LIRCSERVERWAGVLLCAGIACALSGCRHRMNVPPLPQILAPVELVEVPKPDLPLIQPAQIDMPPTPIAAAAAHPHRPVRRPVVKAVVTPSASTGTDSDADETAAIGALSTGGDSSPRSQKEATEMIAAIEKRLSGLGALTSEEQKAQISKVRNFQKQAQDALSSGDMEGAKTLATKAKLLLDDLEK